MLSSRTCEVLDARSFSYTLVEFVGARSRPRHTPAPTLERLALAAFQAALCPANDLGCRTSTSPSPGWIRHHLQAYGPRAEPLDVEELVSWGRRLSRQSRPVADYFRRQREPVAGYVRRCGPVPGVHKLHSYRWHRSPQTMNERRMNAPSCRANDAQEPAARPGRYGYSLVSDRDDICRSSERSWKAQHKGRKAWDRLR